MDNALSPISGSLKAATQKAANFQPLTKDQYQNAIGKGFSSDQIISFEKQRKQNFQSPLQKTESTIAKVPGALVGNTLAFGKTIGQTLAAPKNIKDFQAAAKQHSDVELALTKRIAQLHAAGQDTSKLDQTLATLQQSRPKIDDFTGGVENTTNEQVIGQAAGTGLEALSGGLLEPGVSGVAEGALKGSATEAALSGAKAGGVLGSVGGASQALQQNKGAGGVVGGAISGGITGALTGGALGGAAAKTPEILQGIADSAGKAKLGISELADRVQNEGISNVAKDTARKVPKLVSKTSDLLAGNEANIKAEKIAAPETQQFIPKDDGGKGKTFGSIVDNVESGIKKYREDSMKALNEVKSQIKGTHFRPDDIGTVVNDNIEKVLGNRATARGLTGFDASSASVDDLKSYGLINDDEEKLLNGLVKTIKNNPDRSDRGILNLKEDIYDKYYKSGNQDYKTSNKIVQSIYDGFNKMVGSANPKLQNALEKASGTIQDIDAMERQFLGSGAEREAKLKTLASNLKNQTLNNDDLELLKKLQNVTGKNIIKDLEGYANFTELLPEKVKTGKFPTASGVKRKAIGGNLAKAAAAAGITGGIIEGGKILTGR